MGEVAFELPVDGIRGAAVFYKEVFGWNTQQLPIGSAVIDTEGKAVDPSNSDGS